jgi:hypothetical protein
MFYVSIERPLHRYSHATLKERRTVRVTLTHLPTGRRFVYKTKREGFAALRAMQAAMAAGTLTITPPEPADAEPVEVAAAA